MDTPMIEDVQESTPLVDLNTADQESLIALPGIGPALAERIIAKRPFGSIDDVLAVQGVGPALLERLQSDITLTTLDDQDTTDELPPLPEDIFLPEADEPAPENEAGEEEEAFLPETPETPATASSTEIPKHLSRSEALWMALGSGLVAFLLSLFVILGLLAGLNGGLRFVRPAELNQISRQLKNTQSQTELINQNLDGLRQRVENLQNLTPRMSEVETSVKALQADLQTTAGQVQALQEQNGQISAQIEQMQQQTSRFSDFLSGLFDLLNRLTPSGGTQ